MKFDDMDRYAFKILAAAFAGFVLLMFLGLGQ